MQQILTVNEIFNEQFQNSGLSLDFINLLKFALKSNYINQSTYQFTVDSIEEMIKNLVFNNLTEEDFDKNLDSIITDRTNEIKFYLRSYLKHVNDPYQSTSILLQGSFDKLLNDSINYYNEKKKILNVKYQELNNSSKYIIDVFPEYKKFVYVLGLKIEGYEKTNFNNYYNTVTACYPTLDGKTLDNVHDLIDVEKMIDNALLEVKILSHFEQKDIIRVIKRLGLKDFNRNIANCVLYNYVFNSFYSDEPEKLTFSSNMVNTTVMEIRNGVYSEDEVLDIIHNGKIIFDEEEKQYLENTFVKEFESTVIKSKQIDMFVKN